MNGSTRIHEWLSPNEPGYTFTSENIAEALGCSRGTVSGYLNRAVRLGSVTVVDRSRRAWVFALVDPAKLHSTTRRSAGGTEGRRIRRAPTPPVSFETLQERLLEIAEELESVRVPLASYTTEELLAEISSRVKG